MTASPAWVGPVPNLLTGLRLALAATFPLLAPEYRGVVVLAAGLSDGLDGWIARRFNAITPLGQLLDGIADKAFVLAAVLTLTFVGEIPWWEGLLVMLRDPQVHQYSQAMLDSLAAGVRDNNIRLSNSGGEIHAVSANVHVSDADPFKTMEQLLASSVGDSINVEHAFYLGFEMAKALTANTLGKQYEQDQPLNWGFLTRHEPHHRLARRKRQT